MRNAERLTSQGRFAENTCDWESAGRRLTVTFMTADSVPLAFSTFSEEIRRSPTVRTVSGLGEEAVAWRQPGSRSALMFRQGNAVVTVHYKGADAEGAALTVARYIAGHTGMRADYAGRVAEPSRDASLFSSTP